MLTQKKYVLANFTSRLCKFFYDTFRERIFALHDVTLNRGFARLAESMHESDDSTFQFAIQQFHHIVWGAFLVITLNGTKEVSSTEYKVEFAMLRVNSLDFGEEITDGANSGANCQTRIWEY